MRVEINAKQDECEIRQTSNETNMENDEWTKRTSRYREYDALVLEDKRLERGIPMSGLRNGCTLFLQGTFFRKDGFFMP